MEKLKKLNGPETGPEVSPDLTSVVDPPALSSEQARPMFDAISSFRMPGFAAVLTSIAVTLGPAAPALAGGQQNKAKSSESQSPSSFTELKPVAERKECAPDNKLVLVLEGRKRGVTIGQPNRFRIKTAECKPTWDKSGGSVAPPSNLGDVKLVVQSSPVIKDTIATQEIKPTDKSPSFPVAFDEAKDDSTSIPKITVTAIDDKGQPIASNTWKPEVAAKPSNNPRYPSLKKPETCHPDPDFKLAIQDDPAFVQEKYGPRDDMFKLAYAQGFRAVRFNIIYSQIKQHGYDKIIAAAKSAKANGLSIEEGTIMADPGYWPGAKHSALSSTNENPSEMSVFSEDTARILRKYVTRFSIGNEPNHKAFSNSLDFKQYDRIMRAGVRGVKAGNPKAKVYGGELASNPLGFKWAMDLSRHSKTAPTQEKIDGIKLHLYYNWINEAALIKKSISKANPALTVSGSEYGVSKADPSHLKHIRQAIRLGICANLRAFTLYQYVDPNSPPGVWNTGFMSVDKLAKLKNWLDNNQPVPKSLDFGKLVNSVKSTPTR